MSAVEPGSTGREHGASGGGIGDGSDRSHAIRHWGRLGGIGAALGMSIVFAVAAWYALERSDMQDEAAAEIPLIKADTGEMKEKPKDPGGLKIPNQDKLVFERITPKPVAPAAGKLAPAPEEPIVKAPSTENLETPAAPVIANKTQMEEVVAPPAPVKAMKQPEAPAAVATHAASPTPPAPPAIANKAKIKAAKAVEVVKAPVKTVMAEAAKMAAKTESLLPKAKVTPKAKALEATLPTPKVAPVTAPKIAQKTVAAAPTKAVKSAKSVKSAKPITKGYRIQMAAYRKSALAAAAWQRLQKAHGGVLGQLSGHTEKADLGKRGVFYRVQAGFFGNAASARAACAKLKAKKQDCIIVPPR